MCHFTLPIAEAGKVLRLLHQEGISGATVFPGFKGVVESINETRLWDRRERVNYWLYRLGTSKGW
jgi:PII-like signaling protein